MAIPCTFIAKTLHFYFMKCCILIASLLHYITIAWSLHWDCIFLFTSGNTLHFYCEKIALLLQAMSHFDFRRVAVLSRHYLASISLVSRYYLASISLVSCHYLGFILFLSQKYLAFILVSLQFCNYTAIRVQSYCI